MLPKKRKAPPAPSSVSTASPIPPPPLPKRKKIVVSEPTAAASADVVPMVTVAAADDVSSGKVVRTKKKRTTAAAAVSAATATIDHSATTTKIQYGVTRKQRHTTLCMMMDAVSTAEKEGGSAEAYIKQLEQRIYDGYLGAEMSVIYNMYRGDLYKHKCLELIWNLRRDGQFLMRTYEPELLASLPSHLIAKGTQAGVFWETWHQKTVESDRRERELRLARAAEKGEGWLKCPKCGGKFDMTMLQMRGADEPATIFLTCQNCTFTKRKN